MDLDISPDSTLEAASSSHIFLAPATHDLLNVNFSRPIFDYAEFWRILTASEFPEKDAKNWMENHYYFTFQISILYIFIIFGIQYLMRNRQPFSLFIPLNAWNLFLAIFSIISMVKTMPEFSYIIYNKGIQASYCKLENFNAGNNGYWVWLFLTSKMFELVDTLFLVLRKKPLIFLHWYHHVLTFIFAYYSYPISPGFNRWGIILNSTVHAFMYSYYFLRSMKINVPGKIAKFITTIQIWQFIISVLILMHLGYLIFAKNVQCDFDHRVFAFAVLMEFSYLILFINFFLKSYVFGGGKLKYKSISKNAFSNGKVLNESYSNGKTCANGIFNNHFSEETKKID